jgi:hypothetical protein
VLTALVEKPHAPLGSAIFAETLEYTAYMLDKFYYAYMLRSLRFTTLIEPSCI